MEGFYILLRANDRVWSDKTIPLRIRIDTCNLVWALAIQICKEQGLTDEFHYPTA